MKWFGWGYSPRWPSKKKERRRRETGAASFLACIASLACPVGKKLCITSTNSKNCSRGVLFPPKIEIHNCLGVALGYKPWSCLSSCIREQNISSYMISVNHHKVSIHNCQDNKKPNLYYKDWKTIKNFSHLDWTHRTSHDGPACQGGSLFI